MIKFSPYGGASKAVKTEIKLSWFDWETLEKKVIVKRREREPAKPWSEAVQEIPVPYYVTDVRWRCDGHTEIQELFVAGLYGNGDAVVSKLAFRYPEVKPVEGHLPPLAERQPPEVTHTELYRGTKIGRIRTLEPDPNGRFVLLITREHPTLYRISFLGSAVSEPTEELGQAAVPYLAQCGVINVAQHDTEGRHYHVYPGNRWHADLSDPATQTTIVLRDSDNDGVFDPPDLLTLSQWTERGYDNYLAWETLCFHSRH